MTTTGVVSARVVVRPPNVPAPPPISLLTQNNTADGLSVISGGDRWDAGGGSIWLEPRVANPTGLWQRWPSDGGSASSADKPGLVEAARADNGSAVQLPIMATLVLAQGALTEWALREAPEGDVQTQLRAAFAAVLPRIIEAELWTGAVAAAGAWEDQFRLKSHGHVEVLTNSAVPFVRALALAEQAAADFGFIDEFGGAFIHVTPALFSLLAGSHHGLNRSPSGRQWTTPSGCSLVCEPGATGTWPEADDTTRDARPGAAPAGDNSSVGWLFVTPAVRIRTGDPGGTQLVGEFDPDLNQRVYVSETPFVLEASVRTTTSVAIPVDYTQEH